MYNSIEIAVRKWGNSLGIRIPKHLAELMNATDGTKLTLIFKSDHVEIRRSDGVPQPDPETEILKPVKASLTSPTYQKKFRGRKTPITLTDGNFEEIIARYPFVIVLFIDYMYLDFYERIEERLVALRELADIYSGMVWFGVAIMEDNELARDRYVGNVWGEEEIRGFINGKLSFKAGKLDDIKEVVEGVLPEEKTASIRERDKRSVPVLANAHNMNEVLSRKTIVVSGFFPPGEKTGISLFNDLARKYKGKVLFTLTTDRVLFNDSSRTFYRNPLFERFNIIHENEILIFRKTKIAKRITVRDRKSLEKVINGYLEKEKK